MKYFLLFMAAVFCSAALYAQPDARLCSQFRKGLFVYTNDFSDTVLLKRTAGRQEERIKKSGVVTKFKIKWIADCSYEIKQVWSNSRAGRKNNGATTTVLITNARKDQYEYSCACKDMDAAKKNRGTMFRQPRAAAH